MVMKCGLAICLLLLTGCSTAPVADLMDWFWPGRLPAETTTPHGGVCLPQGNLPPPGVPIPAAPPAGPPPAPPAAIAPGAWPPRAPTGPAPPGPLPPPPSPP